MHARQARNLVATLRAVVPSTTDALDELRSTVAGDAADLDQAIDRGRAFATRVWNSGLTADERRTLRNEGRTDNQIAGLETELRGYAYSEGFNVDSASLLAALDESRAAHAATAAALDTAYDKWNDIVTAIEGGKAPDTHPAVAAGGPYSAGEGAAAHARRLGGRRDRLRGVGSRRRRELRRRDAGSRRPCPSPGRARTWSRCWRRGTGATRSRTRS